MSSIYSVDPLHDSRWTQFVAGHPCASVFHTVAWLEALRRTYRYRPIVLTTSPPDQPLADGLALCRVETFLTGPRLVSLPFSDHCQPLANSSGDTGLLLSSLVDCFEQYCCKQVEVRPLHDGCLLAQRNERLVPKQSFCYHALDLRPELGTIFRGLHSSCVRRNIHRAEKEGLVYCEGRSDILIRQFYSLLVMTRRRHGLVPQPVSWYRNLRDCLGELMRIRVVSWRNRPVAGMITLQYKNRMVYKYGGSDSRFHRLGGMAFLFWQAIQEAKRAKIEELDLGRSDLNDHGLIDFKNHLGAVPARLTYYCYPEPPERKRSYFRTVFLPSVCARMPRPVLRAAGTLFYGHMG